MNTMTWEEIYKDWCGLQKKHRMELAQAVARYCVGHSMDEVGEKLGYSRQWVRSQLELAGFANALGGGGEALPPLTGSGINDKRDVGRDVSRVMQQFGPDVKVSVKDDGRGNQVLTGITGNDAEAFEPYLDKYLQQGQQPSAASRLAHAEWAAEAAVEAGVIKEDVNKQKEKVNRILFPGDGKDTFELDLKFHMARVESAARFLNEAKINHLRRKSTCEKVAAAHEAWLEQVERVLNLHPTFSKD